MVQNSHFLLWQVNIPWEDILQEEQNKSVFVIELGDSNQDNEHSVRYDIHM